MESNAVVSSHRPFWLRSLRGHRIGWFAASAAALISGCASPSTTSSDVSNAGAKSGAPESAAVSSSAVDSETQPPVEADLAALTERAAADIEEFQKRGADSRDAARIAASAPSALASVAGQPTRNTTLRDTPKRNTAIAPRAAQVRSPEAAPKPEGTDDSGEVATEGVAGRDSGLALKDVVAPAEPPPPPDSPSRGASESSAAEPVGFIGPVVTGSSINGASSNDEAGGERAFLALASSVAKSLRESQAEKDSSGPSAAPTPAGPLSLAALESFKPGTLADLDSPNSSLGKKLSADDFVTLKTARDRVATNKRVTEAANTAIAALSPDRFSISRSVLCSRVRAFGDYEPLEGETFVAGRRMRAVVYTELDGLTSRPARPNDRGFRASAQTPVAVDVEQTIQLYQDDGGLLLWQTQPKARTEVSLSRRRDFYLVELIELPITLPVGRYRLKVSVNDRNGKAMAETSLPINLVADASAIRGSAMPASGGAAANQP